MLSDIEIAQQANMKKITEIAASLGISEDDIEPYGHYKAKLSEKLFAETADKPDGKLILVTAINPTPAGKVIGREVSTDEEQDRLIDEFIGELDDDGDK